jgi:DNA-binding transcriptional regulator YhcF (GntR family)
MISFENFRDDGGRPVYLQIVDYVKRGAAAGSIADGDELPSRRVLSALLGINPNTVQRAFKMLEDAGLIESRAGAKSFMTLSPESIEKLRSELLTQEIGAVIQSLKQAGMNREDALALIDKYWDQ